MKCKYDPVIGQRLIEQAKKNPLSVLDLASFAASLGVTRRTLQAWIRQGLEARTDKSELRRFVEGLEMARAELRSFVAGRLLAHAVSAPLRVPEKLPSWRMATYKWTRSAVWLKTRMAR